ncbi:MAG TPA: hemerythrin domain-containing protein [Terriglobales bacterium]|jgi:hemerythrin-like domain-containing protein|nr:hemerythrin domain-containing protein [Terriglobales bacterium]
MPVQIGAKNHHFTEPLGLLSDCHRRIEVFLGSLSAIAKVAGPPLNDEGRRALENALRYFRDAAPKHTADEEQSLFPRLSALHSEESDAVLARMEELEKDHQWAASLHTEVERLGQKYLDEGSLSDHDSAEFRNAMDALAAMYRRHIKIEDESLFPFAAKALSQADKLAIAAEMAERRETRR